MPTLLDTISRSGQIRRTIVYCPFWCKGDLRWPLWEEQASKLGLEMRIQPWDTTWNPHSLEVEIALEAQRLGREENSPPICIFTREQQSITARLRQRGIACIGVERRWRSGRLMYWIHQQKEMQNQLDEPLLSHFFEEEEVPPTLCLFDGEPLSTNYYRAMQQYFRELKEDVALVGYLDELGLDKKDIELNRADVFRMLTTHRGNALTGMALDAVDYCYSTGTKRIALAGWDSSLSLIAKRLREDGVQVIGFGGSELYDPFRESCSLFHEFEGSKDKTKRRAQTFKSARKIWSLMKALGYIPEDCEKPFIPLDRMKLFMKLNKIFWNANDNLEQQLKSLEYQMDRLEEKSWVENPGDRVVHDYPKKIRFHPLRNVMAWKMLHTTDYISKKMRKYKDEDAKHMAVEIFLSRNSERIPGYFDELITSDEKLSELTLLLRNQHLPHRWKMAPSEDQVRGSLVRNGYLTTKRDSPYMVSLALDQMLENEGIDRSDSVVSNLTMYTALEQEMKRKTQSDTATPTRKTRALNY